MYILYIHNVGLYIHNVGHNVVPNVVPFAFPPTAMYMSTMQQYVCIHVLVDPAAFHDLLAQDLLATLPQDHEG